MTDASDGDWNQTFDRMYASDDDPWKFRSRWYEVRKRALTLASLPRERYGNGFEIGCSNGELSAQLAERCDRLWACDVAPRAVELAQARVASLAHVIVERRSIPQDWPEQAFDLIVFSEVGYFMDRAALGATVQRFRAAFETGASVLACHWRHPIDRGWIDGDGVHARVTAALGEPLGGWCDADFRIDHWARDRRSVAAAEGLIETAPPVDNGRDI